MTHMPEEPYTIDIALELAQSYPLPASPRTPLRSLVPNSNSRATTPLLFPKTPGTVNFNAKLAALRTQTPELLLGKLVAAGLDAENWDAETTSGSGRTPLVQKTCPPKQTGEKLVVGREVEEVRKRLFRATRRSLGEGLLSAGGRRWEDQ
jgi:hypothetical protein